MSEWRTNPRPIPGVLRPRSDTSDKSGQLTAREDECPLGQLVPMQNWNGIVKQSRDAKALKMLFVKPDPRTYYSQHAWVIFWGEEMLKIIFFATKICEALDIFFLLYWRIEIDLVRNKLCGYNIWHFSQRIKINSVFHQQR